jgi:hypothetical protein
VSVDIDLIDAAIEAAVLKEFNKPETRSATEKFLDEG